MSSTVECTVHANSASPPTEGLDLLKLPGVGALVRWPGFPYVFQALMLLVFLGLIALGWGLQTPAGVNAKLYAKTNLVTLLIWGLWWPAMVWTAVLLGRAWCMVCPLELVSNVSERLGRRLGLPQRHVRKWLASGVVILLLYLAIQLLVAGAQIHRTPHYTSWFLIALLAGAALTGLLLNDRAFCRAFCPVGLLLGTYGRGGMLAVRSWSTSTCAGCTGRDCLLACNRNKINARSCPSLLNPPKLNTNRDCLVCGQCIKSCQPDNMTMLLRRPFSAADARERLGSWPVTLFVMMVSGFVVWEVCTEWVAAEHAFLAVPTWFNDRLQVDALAGYVRGVWALILVPLAVWTVVVLIARGAGSSGGFGNTWRRLALPMAVVISAGHMAKGLAKVASWGGYLPPALADPFGSATAQAITAKSQGAPAALLSIDFVAALCAILVVISWLLAVRESRLAQGRYLRGDVIGISSMAMGVLVIVIGWGMAA